MDRAYFSYLKSIMIYVRLLALKLAGYRCSFMGLLAASCQSSWRYDGF